MNLYMIICNFQMSIHNVVASVHIQITTKEGGNSRVKIVLNQHQNTS